MWLGSSMGKGWRDCSCTSLAMQEKGEPKPHRLKQAGGDTSLSTRRVTSMELFHEQRCQHDPTGAVTDVQTLQVQVGSGLG